MLNIQQQIEKLQKELENYHAQQKPLNEEDLLKIAHIEGQIQTLIQTQGGAVVEGDVHLNGGDFVGRDQYNVHLHLPEENNRPVYLLPPRPGLVFQTGDVAVTIWCLLQNHFATGLA